MARAKKKTETVVKPATPPKSSISTDIGGTPPNGEGSNGNKSEAGPEESKKENTPATPPIPPIEDVKPPETPETTPETETKEEAPGEEEKPVEHPAFDYKGKVRITDQEFDAVNKEHALKVVKQSHVYEHYKKELTNQIKAGKIEPNYVHMLRMIISADDKGQKYSGTLEG